MDSLEQQPTLGQHLLSGRTLAVSEAHVVLLPVVVSLFALTPTVAVRGARRLHHLLLAAHPAAQTLPDVVPQLREGARRTRRALALARRRAARPQEGPGGAAVTHHRGAGERVRVLEGQRRCGHTVNQGGAQREQHHREKR